MYNLKGLRKEIDKTQSEIADLFDCKQNNISMQEKSNRDLTNEQMNILYANFKKDIIDKYIINEPNHSTGNEDPKINFTTGVPYYNVDFIGGFDLVTNDQTLNPEYLIDFKKYNDAMCWCNVTGHSMEPEINNGDMIALKEVVGWREYLPFGEVYGIVTNEHRTIKRVTASSKGEGFLRLIPTNRSEEYQPQDIPTKLIIAIYKVLGCNKRL